MILALILVLGLARLRAAGIAQHERQRAVDAALHSRPRDARRPVALHQKPVERIQIHTLERVIDAIAVMRWGRHDNTLAEPDLDAHL